MSNSADLVGRINSRVHDGPMDHEHMLDEAVEEIERLRTGINALVNCQSLLSRSVVREALAELLNGKSSPLPDQSPFIAAMAEWKARALASESKLREIEAETREKCAKIAESTPGKLHYAFGRYECMIPPDQSEIAAAIRSQASQGEKK